MIWKAKYIIPVTSAPIENGVLEIAECEDGPTRIVDIRRASSRDDASQIIDLGDYILMPGLVNAHTHLELTYLEGMVRPDMQSAIPTEAQPHSNRGVFTDWLRRLIKLIMDRNDNREIAESAEDGIAMSMNDGVLTIGDVTRMTDVTRVVLDDGGAKIVSFGEVIGAGQLEHLADDRLAAALDRTDESSMLISAISPHTLYTCSATVLTQCLQAAQRENMRLCLHLAESIEETECLRDGRGPLFDLLCEMQMWSEQTAPPGKSPVEYAASLGLLTPQAVCAHVNYVNDSDLDILAQSGAHVAYCPRTHAAFGHAPHRFREMLDRGINVSLGTDSLATAVPCLLHPLRGGG